MFSSLYETCHTNTTNSGATLQSPYTVVEYAGVNMQTLLATHCKFCCVTMNGKGTEHAWEGLKPERMRSFKKSKHK